MTTLDFEPIATRLESAGLRFRAARVLDGVGLWMLVVLPLAAMAVFAAGLLALPSLIVMSGLLGLVGLAIFTYVKTIHTPLWQRPTYGQIARWIEENAAARNLRLRNDLINAVLLSHEGQSESANPLIPAVLDEIATRTAAINLDHSVPWGRTLKRLAAAGTMLVVIAIAAGLFPGPFGHGLQVLANPLG